MQYKFVMAKSQPKSTLKSMPKSQSKPLRAKSVRPHPNDPRLHKVVLTFTVKIEEGSILSERMLDACSVAAEILGVKSGEILPGARLGLSSAKPGKDEM